jgi:hypothetical protein
MLQILIESDNDVPLSTGACSALFRIMFAWNLYQTRPKASQLLVLIFESKSFEN